MDLGMRFDGIPDPNARSGAEKKWGTSRGFIEPTTTPGAQQQEERDSQGMQSKGGPRRPFHQKAGTSVSHGSGKKVTHMRERSESQAKRKKK